jgi:hypothetical protein
VRQLVLALTLSITGSVAAVAGPVVVKNHNFAIDIPPGWQPMKPPAPNLVVAVQSSDRHKKVLVGAATLSPNEERVKSSRNAFEGMKAGMTNAGWKIVRESGATLSGVLFHSVVAEGARSTSAIAYVSSTGEEIYSIQMYSDTIEASSDPELKSILRSFHFISARSGNESVAFRMGYFLGHYGIPLLVVIVFISVAWIIVRRIRKT